MANLAEELKKIQDYVKSLEEKVAELEKAKKEKEEAEQKMKGKVPQQVIDYIKNNPREDRTFDYLCQYGVELGFDTLAFIRDVGRDNACQEILRLAKTNKDLARYLVKERASWEIFECCPFKPTEVIDLTFEKQIVTIDYTNGYCDYTSEEVLEYIVKCLQERKRNNGFLQSIIDNGKCPPRYCCEFAKYGIVIKQTMLHNADFIKYIVESKMSIEDLRKIWQSSTLTEQEYWKNKEAFDLLFYNYPDLIDYYSAIPLQVAFVLNLNSSDFGFPSADIKHKKVLEGNHKEFQKDLAKKLSDKDKIMFCSYVGLPLECAGFDAGIWIRFSKERNEFLQKIGKA